MPPRCPSLHTTPNAQATLNQEELNHVKKLITEYSDRLQMSDGPVEPTNAAVHSIPTVDERRYFSVFDLATVIHHIPMDPKYSHKTAFSNPFRHYEFDKMPFGFKNAPATFQRLMDIVLTGLQGTEHFVY